MSCFESSTFLKNPFVMNQEVLVEACKKLGWKYTLAQEGAKEALYIIDTGGTARLYGEYALKVVDNVVSYNDYYLNNGKELVTKLEGEFYELNVNYARETILREFGKVGFKFRMNRKFRPNEAEKERFWMVANSRMTNETDKRVEIEFTIKQDGTIVSDSNYIPEDIHELADQAMSAIDNSFGNSRKEGVHIKRKKIPSKYKGKTYCMASGQIKSSSTNTTNKLTIKRK